MDFKVGQIVNHKKLEEEMEIVDILTSGATGSVAFVLKKHDGSTILTGGKNIEAVDNTKMDVRFEFREKEVHCDIISVKDEIETVLGSGYGYIMGSGVVCIAQAASWAMKKAYDDLELRNKGGRN